MRIFYSLLFFLLLPILLIRLTLKIKKSRQYQLYPQNGRWKERLGWFPKLNLTQDPIWIHTVSVGEFMAAMPLINKFLEQHPDVPVLVTCTTLTGSDQILKSLGDQVSHVYLPWDCPFAVKRFYRQVRPRIGLIMETEIWPNLIHYGKKSNIPMVLLNARMSVKSARGYQKLSTFSANVLQKFSAICVQNSEDAGRFKSLGAKQETLHITGSIKFDLTPDAKFKLKAEQFRNQLNWHNQQVLIAASTHESEDELVLGTYKRLRTEFPDLKLVVVPRHPERFEHVFQQCRKSGFAVLKRTQIDKSSHASIDILLGDSMGEMMLYFDLGTVVIMGGTFMPNGGHNILEPAALGLPIFYGPSMFNFKIINELFLERHAAVQLSDKNSLYDSLSDYLKYPQKLELLGKNALEIMKENAGAKDRMYQIILDSGVVK